MPNQSKTSSRTHSFELFKTRRFCPLFVTQFLGAYNDNLYKTALMLVIAYHKNNLPFNQDILINLCAALFILPYFLFSAFAGQLADKFEKSRLILITKLLEVILSILALLGFYLNHLSLLLCTLFLLGTQATFFGPLKYSILPQHLQDSELLAGNGYIEMGTFIAILLGTIVAGLLLGINERGDLWVALMMIAVGACGLLASFFIPEAKTFAPKLKLDWNLIRKTRDIVSEGYQNPVIFYTIIGISWFWFFGSIFLTQIPNFVRTNLSGNEQAATLLLTAISVGIGVGSISSSWLSNKKVELGFVFLGLSGLTLFSLDFASTAMLNKIDVPQLLNAAQFLSTPHNWRILLDGLLMGIFCGIYSVPLYTLLQKASKNEQRSQIIAANNIVNALFMVIAALFAMLILSLGFSIPKLFIITAVLNAGMAFFLFREVPGLRNTQ